MKLFTLFIASTLLCLSLMAAEAPPPGTSSAADTNTHDLLRAFVQVQEQLHANQLAIEAARKEADEAATRNAKALAQNAEALATRLKSIEESMARQRGKELESIQSSSRMMLIVTGGFAVLGVGAMLFMAFMQWRTVSRLTELTGSVPGVRPLGPAPEVRVIGNGAEGPSAPVVEASAHLSAALDQLEKRIHGLEQRSRFPLQAPSAEEPGSNGHKPDKGGETAGSQDLMARGQTLLEEGSAEEALSLFEEAEVLEPARAEVHVRKGAAFERLGKYEEAMKSYDKAIDLDPVLTVAYLHKGGLLNRMERYTEALDCYEKALRTQEAVPGN